MRMPALSIGHAVTTAQFVMPDWTKPRFSPSDPAGGKGVGRGYLGGTSPANDSLSLGAPSFVRGLRPIAMTF